MNTDWKAVVEDLRAQGYVGTGEIDDAIAAHQIPEAPHHEPFPVREYRESGLLWFVNNAILWPLGVAIAVSVDTDGKEGPPGSYDTHLTLSQWAWPDGHRETIETTWEEARDIAKEPGGKHPWQRLLEWLPGRIQLMPDEERQAALRRLEQWGIYEAGTVDKPREVWTKDGMEYEIDWSGGVSRETSPVDFSPVDAGDEQG